MKNKYGFWKHGFNCLAGLAGLACLVGLTGCKELTCDFTYSPTTPAAGQVVTFTNTSKGADEYVWNFGDNGTSTSTSPTHIFRKKGTYLVSLTIVRNKVEKRSRNQYITIIDTIPAIACDSSPIYSFTPVKFYAQVYNPWKRTVTYDWRLPQDAIVLAGQSLDSSAVVCYFNQSDTPGQVGMKVQVGDKAYDTTYTVAPEHLKGISVIYTDQGQAYEQYTYIVYQQRVYQAPSPTSLQTNLDLLDQEQDTLYQYGGHTYTIAIVSNLLGRTIQGFQVDRLLGKIYAYNEAGMWVSDMTGNNQHQLVSTEIKAIKVDGGSNCLYWATSAGLFRHSLLQTKDNLEPFVPQTVTSEHTAITKISVNSILH